MRFRALLLMVAALMSGAAFVTPAAAQIEVDINAGAVKPLPIAIPAFSGATRGAEIAQVISGNLERSGLFQPLNVSGVPDKLADVNIQPRFPDWQATGAQALINGQVTVGPDGGLRVDFRLWDVFSQQQLLGLQHEQRVVHGVGLAIKRQQQEQRRKDGQHGDGVEQKPEAGQDAQLIEPLIIRQPAGDEHRRWPKSGDDRRAG